MNMESNMSSGGHEINPEELNQACWDLYNYCIQGECGSLQIKDTLKSSVNNLKTYWKGIDAGSNINLICTLYNDLNTLESILATMVDAISKLACDTRQVTIEVGGSGLSQLNPLRAVAMLNGAYSSSRLEYSDTSMESVIYPEANEGYYSLLRAEDKLERYKENLIKYRNKIFDSWKNGRMSEEAEAAFEKFINKDYNMYKQNIETVKSRVNAALIAHNVKK